MPPKKYPNRKDLAYFESIRRLYIDELELALQEDDSLIITGECGGDVELALTQNDAILISEWFADLATALSPELDEQKVNL